MGPKIHSLKYLNYLKALIIDEAVELPFERVKSRMNFVSFHQCWKVQILALSILFSNFMETKVKVALNTLERCVRRQSSRHLYSTKTWSQLTSSKGNLKRIAPRN